MNKSTIDVPQADRLETVREVVLQVTLGSVTAKDLSNSSGLGRRNVSYCIKAGHVLGLLEDMKGTNLASSLLATDPFSLEERETFRLAILCNLPLIEVTGDILDDKLTLVILTDRLQAQTGLSAVTAKRRAGTLLAWRRYLTGDLPKSRFEGNVSVDEHRLPLMIDPDQHFRGLRVEVPVPPKREPGTHDARAIALVKLWLGSVGIRFETTENPEVLSVCQQNDTKVLVQVVLNGSPDYRADLRIYGPRVTGRKLKDGLAAFSELQKDLGYEPKLPVDRGKVPELKLSNGADFDLTAFRHTEFRRVPNPDPKKFKAYEDTIMRTVWKFFRENAIICQDNMLEVADLKTYAMIWTTTFLGMSEIDPEQDKANENVRLLYTYLGQRFYDFRTNLMTRGRNILPSLDDAHLGQHGTPYEHNNKLSWESPEPEGEEESLIERRKREWRRGENFKIDITVAGSAERRDAAAGVLDGLLGGYEHDDMVKLLKDAAESSRTSPDARTEAVKRLRIHGKTCSVCRLGLEGDKNVGGGDPAGVVEKIFDTV